MRFLLVVIAVALGLGLLTVLKQQRALKRALHIRNFELPRGLFERLRKHHPGLSTKDCQLVAQALRQFFLAYLRSGRQYVAMPSQVVDDLWHEFILYTKNYDAFCKQAFGGFLHHTPAAALGKAARKSNAGLRRCFWFTCKEENINPRKPLRLPLLFAIDSKLAIASGFAYVLDCQGVRDRADATRGGGTTYCGGDFADASFDGSTDGFGDASSDGGSSDSSDGGSSSSSGDGGSSCGGGGCGGGGCGGGD